MTDAAPMHVTLRPLEYFERAGMFAMELALRPRCKFAVHDGDRRRFHDRTPRPPVELKIVSRKDQP
jgi:hypothetical protein